MDEGGTVSILCRKELRKQKLMEYLAAKGKLKLPNPKPYLRDDCRVKKPATSALKPDKGKENKAPDAFSIRNEDTKVQPRAGKVISHPTGTVSGGTYKVSVQKGGIFPGAQNANRPVAPCGPTQPKLKQKPVPTRTYTVASSKSNHRASSQPKKQPNIGIHAAHPSSGKSFSNAAHTALTQPNRKSNSCTNVTRSGPNNTNNVRMSLGPIVKTKTGLIPAVVQPRNTKSNLTCSPAAASATTTTSIANRVHSSTSLSVSVSQRSTMAQRKTFPATVVNKPVQKRTTATGTASAGFKIQARIQSISKPLLDKPLLPSCKSQPSTGLRPTYVSSRRTTAPVKPDEKERVSKTAKSVFQPTNKAAQQRSEGEEAGNSRPCRVGSRTSSGPASRCSSRAMNGFMQTAVAELGEKAKMHKQTDNKKGDNSAKVSPPQAGTIRAGIPLMPQTVPRSARSASQAAWATDMKTPRAPVQSIPQTEGKKLTAAQEERMRKLQEWREARGISYKRPPMPVKPRVRRTVVLPQPYWATMKEEDEAHSLICAVDRSLADCIKLLGEGCPPDQVKEVLSRLPMVARKFAKYWICQARLMEQQGNLDVLPMFEEAVRVVLEPVDELRTVVFEILKKKDEIQGPLSVTAEVEEEEDQISEPGDDAPEGTDNPMVTPKPVRVFICGEKGDSSVVKYKITATPGYVHKRGKKQDMDKSKA
ncbi:cytoskeleton-associated protein 2-like isoform X2 [Centroberyx affinis]|uniref:cytoskeleton-associated protein 2-like isoform X2 n=1 Tax=Centroberyx affinis TaxID=166261 RepID=UPI003A5BDA15